MRNDTLFLTLRTFSATGGIEKVCRIMGKALYERSLQEHSGLAICSMYDETIDAEDNPYFPAECFTGYGIRKLDFMQAMVRKASKYQQIIVSHINLLPIVWIVKKFAPNKKIILLAHGIEVWYPVSSRKLNWLRSCDAIFCVSKYTAQAVVKQHGLSAKTCKVLNNCVDPFMPLPVEKIKAGSLMQRYNFSNYDKILFTLARLSVHEKYKGYDKVLEAIHYLNDPQIKYLIGGKADAAEQTFLKEKILNLGLEKQVVLAGFIPEEELAAHFYLSDCYIMPSKGEGFGVVFIEAMHYGVPVIAGNLDGSVDALDNGNLGLLVDPDDNSALQNAITEILEIPEKYKPDNNHLRNLFSYETYKNNLGALLEK